NAKAGQTLASLHEFAIYMIGPVVRMVSHYLHLELKKMREHLDNDSPLPGDRYLFILGTNDPNQMEAFVQSYWQDTNCLANDYTKYDQSQNHEFLHFEDLLHQHLRIPNVLRDMYVWLKTNTQTFLKNLSVMRITGGAETYNYNTIENIAYTFLNFVISPEMPTMFSGDDSCICGVPKISTLFQEFGHEFALQGKP
ncbi:10936_t:CDS:1, partial [Racocetra fulgida]